ncbi:MAG: STAS domain-containing protein [Terriglobales bacterium]
MELRFQVERQHDVAVVRCSGRLVRGKALDEFRRGIERLEHVRVLVVDLSEIEQLDAGGLGTLLLVRRWARLNAVQMKLVNPSAFVLRVLEATRLTAVFEISSLEEALCILQAPGDRPHFAVA